MGATALLTVKVTVTVILFCSCSPSAGSVVPHYQKNQLVEVPETCFIGTKSYAEPFSLHHATGYLDGGTVCFELADAKKQPLYFCENQTRGSNHRGRFFLNAHPKEGGEMVLDRADELLLLSILSDAFLRFYGAEEIHMFKSRQLDSYDQNDMTYWTTQTFLDERLD